MILIWSTDGGPFQYVGLVLFTLQCLPFSALQLSNLSATTIVGIVSGVLAGIGAFLTYTNSWNTLFDTASARWREGREWIRNSASFLGDNWRQFMLGFAAATGLAILSLHVGSEIILTAIQLVFLCFVVRAHMQQGREGDERSKEKRISEIVKMIQSMPIEDFVPEDEMMSLTVSQLRRMLEIRGCETDALEKKDLEEAVRKCRNYNDTCCICCEEYNSGDLLRVLPKCHHEFHLECVDQWAYTFANRTKRAREPTCPLCNIPLK